MLSRGCCDAERVETARSGPGRRRWVKPDARDRVRTTGFALTRFCPRGFAFRLPFPVPSSGHVEAARLAHRTGQDEDAERARHPARGLQVVKEHAAAGDAAHAGHHQEPAHDLRPRGDARRAGKLHAPRQVAHGAPRPGSYPSRGRGEGIDP
eukprot:9390256-Pyramimonas_sp.AAC.2